MNKQTIREQARFHRDKMSVDQLDFERVINIFFQYYPLQREDIVALYWPIGREFDCRFLIDELLKRGYRCALPSIEKNERVLTFKTWKHDEPLGKGKFGIKEPIEGEIVTPTIIIAPLLAFDRYGYRLGQGGGYYDATIAHYRKKSDVTAIGLGYAQQAVLFNLPVEDHDQRMDFILTPERLIDHRKKD